MNQTFRLTVESNREIGPNLYVMAFECPEMAVKIRSGQFAMIKEPDTWDPLLARAFAFHSVWSEGNGESPTHLDFLYEVMGQFSRRMASMGAGNVLDLLGPLGHGFEPMQKGIHLMVAGGVGSAPFPLLAREIRQEQGQEARIRLLYGAATKETFASLEKYEPYGVEVVKATMDGSEGVEGPVTVLLNAEENLGNAGVYACGPEKMLEAVCTISKEKVIPSQISLEARMACGYGVCLSCVKPVKSQNGFALKRVCREGPIFDGEKLLWEIPA